MTSATQLLSHQLNGAYEFVRHRVEGLTDEEFLWEPFPGCWTVRRGSDGRWSGDYADVDPDPAPFTTIAWRLVHLAECKLMYHEYAFGAGRLTWPEIDSAHTANTAIAELERGQQLLVDDLAGLGNVDLDGPRLTNWGEEWPTWRIFWTMIDHDLHHGGEIGVLRDLYREGIMHRPAARAKQPQVQES